MHLVVMYRVSEIGLGEIGWTRLFFIFCAKFMLFLMIFQSSVVYSACSTLKNLVKMKKSLVQLAFNPLHKATFKTQFYKTQSITSTRIESTAVVYRFWRPKILPSSGKVGPVMHHYFRQHLLLKGVILLKVIRPSC